MYLDTVKSRLNGAFCGFRKVGDNPFDFRNAQGARYDEGTSLAVFAQHSTVGFDLGGSDWPFAVCIFR